MTTAISLTSVTPAAPALHAHLSQAESAGSMEAVSIDLYTAAGIGGIIEKGEETGDYIDVIGDFAVVSLISHVGIMTSVAWTVSGAYDASTYWYSTSLGKAEPLQEANPVVHEINSQYDIFNFYWDNRDGAHAVSATATFADGSHATDTITVNVQAPTVQLFRDTYAETNAGSTAQGVGLLNMTNNSFGQVFNATVSTVTDPMNHGGRFAFLQLVKIDRRFFLKSGGVLTTSSNDAYVLDSTARSSDPGGPPF